MLHEALAELPTVSPTGVRLPTPSPAGSSGRRAIRKPTPPMAQVEANSKEEDKTGARVIPKDAWTTTDPRTRVGPLSLPQKNLLPTRDMADDLRLSEDESH